MRQLLKTAEMAGMLREYLMEQADKGYHWVVFDTDHPIGGWFDLHCFLNERAVVDFAREYQQIWNWHEPVPLHNLLFQLKELELGSTGRDAYKDDFNLKK